MEVVKTNSNTSSSASSSKLPKQVVERTIVTKDTPGIKKEDVGKNNDANMGAVIANWPNNDVWPFKVAVPLLSLAAGGMGFFINSTFRKALILERSGIVSSYFATVGVPSFSAGVGHVAGVMMDVMEQKTRCPVCVQVRSAAIQFVFGVFVPILTCPVASYGTASMLKDVYLPKITKHPKEILKFSKKVYSGVKTPLGFIAAGQIILAMGMTYLEQECLFSTVLPILDGRKTFDPPKPSALFSKNQSQTSSSEGGKS